MSSTVVSFAAPPPFVPMYLKAIFGKRRAGLKRGQRLPSLTAECASMSISEENLAAYRRVCGIANDVFPPLYPHVVAGSLHLAILTHKDFPLSAMGTLHVRNHILQRRALRSAENVSVACALGENRVVKSGIELDITTVFRSKEERVWEGISTYLVRGKFGEPEEASPRSKLTGGTPDVEGDSWHLTPGIGRRYAKVSGDYNPIHLSPILGKLFGYRRDFVHGMWAAASCLAHIVPPKSETVQCDFLFKGPNFINSTVRLLKTDLDDGIRFDLFCGNNPKPTINGSQRAVDPSAALVE